MEDLSSKESLAIAGKWANTENPEMVVEIKDDQVINEEGKSKTLAWRNDLGKWVIPGLSISILSVKDGVLYATTPENNMSAGEDTYHRVEG